AALPDVERIVAAIRTSMSTRAQRLTIAGPEVQEAVGAPVETAPKKVAQAKQSSQPITVPIMGEGIPNAKIVSLLKKPGDPIALDDPLCEVETDKAVYPIESSFAGVMGEWKTRVGDTVEIGQELGSILTAEPSFAGQFDGKTVEAAVSAADLRDRGRHARPYSGIEPALSPTITRKL